MTNLHVQAGMFGALIIEARDAKEDLVRRVFPYQREYTLLLSEVDTVMDETRAIVDRIAGKKARA